MVLFAKNIPQEESE